ncbi:MEMO1 family protein [Methanosphaera sp.]
MIREPSVSGLFYAGNYEVLENTLEDIFETTGNEIPTTSKEEYNLASCIMPHAGYVFSGKTASYTAQKIAEDGIPETIIIIGPNHTGYGNNVDLTNSLLWKTPLGNVGVDTEFIDELVKEDANANINEVAHIKEHSIEVEIPFLQYIANKQNKTFKIVPIIITRQEKEICTQLAKSIKNVSAKLNRQCIIIASTDLTHYEDNETARIKDEKVLKSIEDMDINSLINNINEYDITMCGYGPTITAIRYAQLVNANKSKILNYSNSGDAYGDYEEVVGYASAIIEK